MSDILFLQKRDRPIEIDADWMHLRQTPDDFAINSYFIDHPEMVLGTPTSESTQYGRQDYTVVPIPGADLAGQLREAVAHISGQYAETELPDLGEGEEIDASIPADPTVKNFSYTLVDGEVYYRENSRMVRPGLNDTAIERVRGMVELRDCVHQLIDQQMDEFTPDAAIREKQAELNRLYDAFAAKYDASAARATSWRSPTIPPTTSCVLWRCWTMTATLSAKPICSPNAPSGSSAASLPSIPPPKLWPFPSGNGPKWICLSWRSSPA